MIVRKMGVINITPDSFSDGSQFNEKSDFEKRFNSLREWADIIDIGAESTAPLNEAVNLSEELARYQNVLFPLLENETDPKVTLSIDTYKVEIFKEIYSKIRQHWPSTKVIFNDVSGKLSEELLDFLGENPEVSYVFCHNLCPSRDKTSQHMDYAVKCSKSEFLVGIVDYFVKGISKLSKHNNEIWIDPCFGFSKTREQNHYLIRHFKSFLLQIPYEIPCVVGLSKKSFLRFPSSLDIKTKQGLINVEQVHSNILFYLFRSPLKRELVVRTHDLAPIENAQNSLKLFEL
ncbi:MAG: hypothetical protein CME65_05705 [Halobacteriovoraceae bacterium]|nr:hypothetical protein [Halobacteriovoraceae bacterium]|tara:strand:- start:7159 stop:8025 length:867 start_codon:yes stop_codon:yes gene_type:complete